jgi:hypothetical protein
MSRYHAGNRSRSPVALPPPGSRVRLWTVQSLEAWAVLDGTGVLRALRERAEKDFLSAYDWMAAEMRRRIGPPPDGTTIPLWADALRNGCSTGARIRSQRRFVLDAGSPTDVFIEVEVPVERVLFSDFHAWETGPLCGWFLSGRGKREGFARYWKRYGVPDDVVWKETPGEAEVILASWPRVFEPQRMRCCVQATLWEIKREDVREATRVRWVDRPAGYLRRDPIRWVMGKQAGAGGP